MRDAVSTPGLGRSPGGGHGKPLQYSCPENPIYRGAWQATVHRVAESDTTGVTEHTGVRGALIAICIDLWRRDDTFSLHCNTLFYVLKQTGSCKTVFPSKKLVGTLSALGSYSTGGAINPRLSCAVGAKCLFTISDCRLHMHSVVSC